ncbi:MAG: TonB-dependent receptor plug domain-containing protein [Chitinophagales bacterium]|nr:TonB-dependent receptor plug domain-containing protein [Chitinophagales bacterium]
MKKFLITLLISASLLSVFAQQGTVRGFVYEESTGEPIIFSTVIIKGTTMGASTDINGFFSLVNVPPGSYTLISTFIGYDTASVAIDVVANKTNNIKVFLEESAIKIREIEISAEKSERTSKVNISVQTITPKKINKIPTIGGEADIAQFLQTMPGVIFTGDQGGQIYIRGGTPVQTKYLLDGMPIYNPIHSIGLFSIFETDAMKNVDVYTGGFGGQFGNRISAVVDVTTRDGNKKELSGKVSANPFLAKLLLEGPLKKIDEKGSSVSFLLSTKYSYLDKSSKALYSYVDSNGIPFNFRDFYGKISATSSTGSKFNLFGFNYSDEANFQGVSNFAWDAIGGGGNFIIIPGRSNIYFRTNFNYSSYDVSLQEAEDKPRQSSIKGFNLGMDFTYFISNGQIDYGLDVTGFKTTFEFFNPLGIIIDQNQNTTELGAYFSMKKHWDKFVIEPSLRLQYYGSLGEISPEPRLGMKYNITDDLRIKVATGIFSQNLISTKSDKDVVNLFTGFLSGPEETLTTIDGDDAKSKLQKAFHIIGGVEYDLGKRITINVEPYYKDFFQLINLNRNKLFPEDSDYLIEEGAAYGLDVLVNYDYNQIFLWAAYSLGYVERNDGNQVYNPHYDRRHNVNLIASYSFGEDLDWEVNARWNFGTGFPFTQTKGFYEQLVLGGGIDTEYETENGNLGIIYADELNGGRLPDYHRLDFSVKKKVYFKNESLLEIQAGVTNIYDRANIFYFDRVRFTRINQLPILPTLGMSFSF